MCWSCNSLCGGCRPPRKRAVVCPECGAFNVVDLEHFHEGNPCSRCGTDLTAAAIPEPVTCLVCGEVCYNPCRKGRGGVVGEGVDGGDGSTAAAEGGTPGVRPCRMRVGKPLLDS